MFDAAQEIDEKLRLALVAVRSEFPVDDRGHFKGVDDRGAFVQDDGWSAEDRRRFMVSHYLGQLIESLGSDPWSWSFLPEEGVETMLGDPLSSETRAVRRNLLVLSSAASFVALTNEVPQSIPGFDLQLGKHDTLVMGLLVAAVIYELVVFLVYAWGDSKKNLSASTGVAGIAAFVREVAGHVRLKGAFVVSRCGNEEVRLRARAVLAHFVNVAPVLIDDQLARRRPGLVRRVVDLLIPVAAGGVSALWLLARALDYWNLWRWTLGVGLLPVAYLLQRWGRAGWKAWRWRRRSLRAKDPRAASRKGDADGVPVEGSGRLP
jgi:hypothetical protein